METLRDLLELTVLVDPMYDQNCYVLRRRDSDAALVIDPGLQNARALQLLEQRSWRCERVLLTHGHGDHVNGVPALVAAHGCRVALHPADREQLVTMRFLPGIPDDIPDVVIDDDLTDGQVIDWHGIDIGVIHTPGHTRGSVCFLAGTDLLSGDTLFRRGIGRADLPGGDWQQLVVSIEQRVYALPADTVCTPGTGRPRPLPRRCPPIRSWCTRATGRAAVQRTSPPTRAMSSNRIAPVTPQITVPSTS